MNQEIIRITNARGAGAGTPFSLGAFKGNQTWVNQLYKRGWTPEDIADTLVSGARYPAPNMVSPLNSATRYENQRTGGYIVRDDVTGEILQLGAGNFDRPSLPTKGEK